MVSPKYVVSPAASRGQRKKISRIINEFGEFERFNPRETDIQMVYGSALIFLSTVLLFCTGVWFFVVAVAIAVTAVTWFARHFKSEQRRKSRLANAVAEDLVLPIPVELWSSYGQACKLQKFSPMITDFAPFYRLLRDETLVAFSESKESPKVQQDIARIATITRHKHAAEQGKYPKLS